MLFVTAVKNNWQHISADLLPLSLGATTRQTAWLKLVKHLPHGLKKWTVNVTRSQHHEWLSLVWVFFYHRPFCYLPQLWVQLRWMRWHMYSMYIAIHKLHINCTLQHKLCNFINVKFFVAMPWLVIHPLSYTFKINNCVPVHKLWTLFLVW